MKTDVTGKTWLQICNIIKEFRERDFSLTNDGGRITLTIGNPVILSYSNGPMHDKEG